MRSPCLSVLILTITGCGVHSSLADAPPTKAQVLSALGESCHDEARFERLVTLAKTLGVTESQISIARIFHVFENGDADNAKRLLPEVEKAFATIPDTDLPGPRTEIETALSNIKRGFALNKPDEIKAIFSNVQRRAEARSILSDLKQIDSAVDISALTNNLRAGANVPAKEWLQQTRRCSRLHDTGADIFGVAYGDQIVGHYPQPNPSSLEKVAKFVPEGYFKLPAAKKIAH